MIIGITGTLGAGKGTIVEYLLEHGFEHLSVRAFIAEEIVSRGMEVNRDTLTAVGNELRAANSPSYIAEQLYKIAESSGLDTIIESIRTVGEVEALRKEKDFFLFAVDCDIRTRYERIVERKSETDRVDFETFRANEEREMHSDDPNKQNLSRCIALADYRFDNSGDLDNLHGQIARVLGEIRNAG